MTGLEKNPHSAAKLIDLVSLSNLSADFRESAHVCPPCFATEQRWANDYGQTKTTLFVRPAANNL